MIIHSNRALKNYHTLVTSTTTTEPAVLEEVTIEKKPETKNVNKTDKKKRKTTQAIIEKEPIVEEKIDLSEWLKDDIDE